MKKLLSLLAVVLTLGLGTAHMDAEAKRIGGGKSLGMQRQATPPAKAPDASPNAAPAAGAAAGAAAAPKRSWMGPVAGLAAGLGLAALASHLGFGEELANMLMIGLMVMAALAVIGFIMRKRAAASQGGMAYAGAAAGAGGSNNAFRMPASPVQTGGAAAGGSMIGANLQGAQPRIPADFDVAAFERNAKVNYIRLQAANDTGNLDDIRQFTSPEMFAELQMDIRDRNGATQHTDVLSLNAQVLEVAEEDALYVVSVRFTGELREDGVTSPVDEIWHLTKPHQGNGGWILAGIQQGA
ncbi:Tim44-like domain-containing protein [Hydrogenophaga sp. NH-16]|uniref:Tim44 domain-containing protein n=1 Tax=Hydrogenophaga sp. NH-16 TaxID=2184519 RepID=UPI000FD6DBA2|nr:Tim44-like domain-containing protein [Hydrogenophaga sp. NH-16]